MEHDWDFRAQFDPLNSATGYMTPQEAGALATDALHTTILKSVNISGDSVALEIGSGMGNLKPLSRMV
jgi:hypothetical protein